MTEDNTKLDRRGRKNCRACTRERKSGYHKGSQGVGRHNGISLNGYELAMAEALEADPPVIVWRKDKGGVKRPVKVKDPHAETQAQRDWDERMAREEARLAALQEHADEIAERIRKHTADNTPLMAAARAEI
jgi:hypothetical protein